MQTTQDSLITDKTRELCQAILDQPEMRSAQWMERQKKKLELGFAAIETITSRLGPSLGVPHITYACMLFFIDQHKIFEGWRETFPKLAAWYDRTRTQPALIATEPKLA